jgi:hypothetical protein
MCATEKLAKASLRLKALVSFARAQQSGRFQVKGDITWQDDRLARSRIMLLDKIRSRLFLKDRCTEFIETKELKNPLAVEVEYSQIIGLLQIALDRLKMPTVALPSKRHWNLKCDELSEQTRIADRLDHLSNRIEETKLLTIVCRLKSLISLHATQCDGFFAMPRR